MEEQSIQEGQGEVTREVNPVDYAFYTIEDALLRARHGLSYLELQEEKGKNEYLDDAQRRTADILGLGGGWDSDYSQEWKALPSEGRENFLDWFAKRDDGFRARYEGFLAEISPLAPSPTAAQEIQDQSDKEQRESYRVYEERRKEAEELPSIESMSEMELRQEIIKHINETLGRLANGPLADGTGAGGYRREWNTSKIYRGESEKKFPLFCAYIRFTKAYEADEQSGVRLELLGLMHSGGIYSYMKQEIEKKAGRASEMSPEDRREFELSLKEVEGLRKAVEDDGLAPSDNRYYFIPMSESDQAVVSTDSFITRAARANPETADRLLGEDTVEEAEKRDSADFDPVTGLPRQRGATLQDLRDAAAIVRGYTNFVKDIIGVTPKDNWGRPGLTE